MSNSLKFGTSGLRGLSSELAGAEARRYVTAFLRVLADRGEPLTSLYLGRDFRDSSPAILRDCAAAAAALGIRVVDCGAIPTPALAAHAIAADAPSVMVTGSHIPQDRNGLKFYTRQGEISKADEADILSALAPASHGDYAAPVVDEAETARNRYLRRYAQFLPDRALEGMRIGIFEHSSVARDILYDIIRAFGAETIALGRVDGFVAVDTEAFGDPVLAPLRSWVEAHKLDAIVSTDGDADRPLMMDALGQFVRGDILGLLSAWFVEADTIVTPVTSNTAMEATGLFRSVRRTRVGSPYVIETMSDALASGAHPVIGFEANGGTLLGNDLSGAHSLDRLMTRDAVLPLLATLGLAARERKSVADLVSSLPLRVAVADRLADVAHDQSARLSDWLGTSEGAALFFAPRTILRSASIDGLQFWLDDGTMVHYRASGNAPELRCYVEAETADQAQAVLAWGLKAAKAAL